MGATIKFMGSTLEPNYHSKGYHDDYGHRCAAGQGHRMCNEPLEICFRWMMTSLRIDDGNNGDKCNI